MIPAVIVGGGISGLSAAYYLNKAGVRATLIEKSPVLGGVIRTERAEGCLVEAGPDSFLTAKPEAMDLIRDLGLESEVIGSNDHLRVTYVLRGGKLIPLPDGMTMMVPTKILPLLATRLLSWPTKIRMGLETFRRPSVPQPDRSISEFLVDHYGRESVDYLAEPLLTGVFGGDPDLLSANSVLTRFVEMEAKYGSLSRGVLAARKPDGAAISLFRTLKGGLGTLVDKLAPAADRVKGEAETIERTDGGYCIRVNGDWIEAEQVFIGAPAYVAGGLLERLNPELGEKLNGIPYNSSMTLSLIYEKATFEHPLKGFGFLVPKLERRRLKACTWFNNKFNFRAAADKVLLRCFISGDGAGESDDSLVEAAIGELREIMGLELRPRWSQVNRWPRAMAQYTVGHATRVDRIQALAAQLPGIRLGGNGYNGIGLPDCIRSGRNAAAAMGAFIPPVLRARQLQRSGPA